MHFLFLKKGYSLDIITKFLNKPEYKNLVNKEEKKSGYYYKSDDPIRLYLEEIGKISLISLDKEIELAKRIEKGENIIEETILGSSLLRNTFLRLYSKVKNYQVKIHDVCRASKTYYVSEKEQKET